MHWVAAGLCLFGFAAPAAVLGCAFTIGSTGLLLGPLMICVTTWSSARGALMLVALVTHHPEAKTLADLGAVVLGPSGEWVGFIAQQGNFFLFLPVALLTCAQGAQAALDPSLSWFDGCVDYWIMFVALVCLAITQVRSLDKLEGLAFVSLGCILVVVTLVIVVICSHREKEDDTNSNGHPEEYLFGNADMRHRDSSQQLKGWCNFCLGLSMASWSYVPSFLTVELLATSSRDDEHTPQKNFAGAIWLSAGLNVVVVVGVGLFVALSWGSDVADPLTLGTTSEPDLWPAESNSARLLNVFWFIANAVSYALDAVPLSQSFYRMWQGRRIAHHHVDAKTENTTRRRSPGPNEWLQFLLVSISVWFFAVVLAFVVPSLFCMLAIVTALTVPIANSIIPSVFYYAWLVGNDRRRVVTLSTIPSQDSLNPITADASLNLSESLIPGSGKAAGNNPTIPSLGMTKWRLLDVASVLTIGITMFLVCSFAALGKLLIPELRGPLMIGCGGWQLYSAS
jgi:hypothetical protein